MKKEYSSCYCPDLFPCTELQQEGTGSNLSTIICSDISKNNLNQEKKDYDNKIDDYILHFAKEVLPETSLERLYNRVNNSQDKNKYTQFRLARGEPSIRMKDVVKSVKNSNMSLDDIVAVFGKNKLPTDFTLGGKSGFYNLKYLDGLKERFERVLKERNLEGRYTDSLELNENDMDHIFYLGRIIMPRVYEEQKGIYTPSIVYKDKIRELKDYIKENDLGVNQVIRYIGGILPSSNSKSKTVYHFINNCRNFYYINGFLDKIPELKDEIKDIELIEID